MASAPINMEGRCPLSPPLKSKRKNPYIAPYNALSSVMVRAIALGTLCCLTTPNNIVSRALAFSPEHTPSYFHDSKPFKSTITFTTCLHMANNPPEMDESNPKENGSNNGKRPKKKKLPGNATNADNMLSNNDRQVLKRITQLERLVSKQEVEISHLRKECQELAKASKAFARIVELLRDAGLDAENIDPVEVPEAENSYKKKKSKEAKTEMIGPSGEPTKFEYFEDSEIFGSAPSSVIDAADTAGASILAALLAGKQRMLVDVRDAELSRDPETLVQFIELAVLPVAAGLEGLKSTRNRVKIVFPTVSQLLMYRRTMALAAPEVVALSTLGFDPIEKKDNLVVIVAPAPDDEEGLSAMNELLQPSNSTEKPVLRQPTVVLNHHMVPVSGPAAGYDVAYHLRLLSVQYMTDDETPEYYKKWEKGLKARAKKKRKEGEEDNQDSPPDILYETSSDVEEGISPDEVITNDEAPTGEEDAALEAAMQHAHELGVSNQGVTRAMVIRAYPK